MCTADAVRVNGDTFGSAADALRMAGAALDHLNSPAAANLDGSACGELLIGLGELQAKLAAAHAAFLRRFDAAGAHDGDGYGSSSAWLAAKGGMSKGAARASVRRMRQLGGRPLLGSALAGGDVTESLAFTIADWTRKLPAGCAPGPTASCWRPRRRARRWTTWRPSPRARSSGGASSGPTPTIPTTPSRTARFGSARRSAAPASSAAA